ncbi:MAG: beta-galactosidase [Anaerolineae bacterium]
MKLGVCYYPEHWPEERWPVDAQLMREAGLTHVRIGEFAWQLMEPAEGDFRWDWLDRAIEILSQEGLQVILGTPTAAPPPWMARAYPNILPVNAGGEQLMHGSRRHYCPTSETYRRHSERIVAAMAKRYGQHPAVVGWQIDNEFGAHDTARCYCKQCVTAFRDWLRDRYRTLEALNKAWGTLFWGQVYTDWNQIAPPALTVTEPNPSHTLDYYRFSSDTYVSYQQLQLDILRKRVDPAQFITTNLMGIFTDLDYHDLARPLDFVSWDSYPTGYVETSGDSFYLPAETRPTFAFDVGDPYITGFCHDLMRGLKQQDFWVMEQQPGQINWGVYNPGVRPEAVRLWTWHAALSGAEAVVYFRWRACRFGSEQYHAALLRHDGSFDVGHTALKSLREDEEQLKALTAVPNKAQVALLLDYEDLWALGLQPHRKGFSYLRYLFVVYRALQSLGIPTDIVSYDADLDRYALTFAPAPFLADDALANHLAAYVNDGGTLLFGIRSGFKTTSNLITEQPLPGPFRDLVGATVTARHALPPDVGYRLITAVPNLQGPATIWAEALSPSLKSRMEVLATYPDGPFQGNAALTGRHVGEGRVLYLGWYPTLAQARAILTYATEDAGIERLADLPEGLVVCRRGDHIALLNFTDEALTATRDGEEFTVAPCNVLVVP